MSEEAVLIETYLRARKRYSDLFAQWNGDVKAVGLALKKMERDGVKPNSAEIAYPAADAMNALRERVQIAHAEMMDAWEELDTEQRSLVDTPNPLGRYY